MEIVYFLSCDPVSFEDPVAVEKASAYFNRHESVKNSVTNAFHPLQIAQVALRDHRQCDLSGYVRFGAYLRVDRWAEL
jgi:hypothetical protein